MDSAFQRFLDQLAAGPDAPQLCSALADILALLDLDAFAYLLMPTHPRAKVRLISTYPRGWTSRYLENRYHGVDPVIRQALQESQSFLWGQDLDTDPRSDSERSFFEEAAQFGIRGGFTIPIYRDRRPMAALTFAFDACQTRFKATIERHGTTLELLGTLFHRSARRLFVSNRMVAGITLSPREFQCLEWSARGKTAWEISVILGISRRTVAYHLDNAKRKLGVHSIAEAVARLVAATATAL